MTYSILDYGAIGDGRTNDAPAIQKAIDDCAQHGGGRVLVPGGRTYKVGSLVLRSYIELHLEMGAVLKASDDKKDFGTFASMEKLDTNLGHPTYENCEYAGKPVNYFLYTKDTEYVAITGFGKIDGNEELFYGYQDKFYIDGAYYPRIPMLFLEHVRHLTIKEVTLTHSAFWTTHLVGCEDVLIDGIRILNNLRMMNCDGIDPDHCRNVRIANCHIESADDCIVFKNTAAARQYGPCQNICVTNCTLTSTSAAIKFGTESEDDFANIAVDNCCITRTNRAISIQLRDPGHIRNCTFSNLNIETRRFTHHWWGKGEAIAITAVDRKKGVQAGTISGLHFANINCHGENGIFIYGQNADSIQDVTFDNITIDLVQTTRNPKTGHDIRPCEGDGLLPGTLNAVHVRRARNIQIRGLKVNVQKEMEPYVEKLVDAEEVVDFSCN